MTCLYYGISYPEFSRFGLVRHMSVGFFDSFDSGRSMTEDEMMWCEVEGSFDLVASPEELDVVDLRPVSVSLIAGP